VAAVDGLTPQADWQFGDPAAVRRDVLDWLASEPSDGPTRDRAAALWAAADNTLLPEQRLQRLVMTFALVRADVRQLVEECTGPNAEPALERFRFLTDPETAPLLRNNMRLTYGRWLAQHRFFDEARTLVEGLTPDEVADPATLLFYQAVVHHQLVDVETSQECLARLLQREGELPHRYRHIARLLQKDLAGVQDDSLDHIARRMNDIERRLHLGRADAKVRQIEDGVVASLDRLIKKLEDQTRQQQCQGGAGGQLQPQSPASDSRIVAGRGPGKVAKKKIGDTADWGNLPDKQREEAMQQIGRRFPSHYREVVEQYFKQLAREK
jgi:hypothetical protein